MVFASFTRTGAIIKPVTGVSAKAEIGAEIRAVIGAGLSASAFGNSVSRCIGYHSAEPYWSRAMPLVIVASRSGDCNSYTCKIVEKVSLRSYKLQLPERLDKVHPMFTPHF